MKRIKYYIRRLKGLDTKNMWLTAKKISKETKKSAIFILIDMIWCSIKYQAGYNDYYEYQFYLLNAQQRKTFITVGIANSIILKYNDKKSWEKFSVKSNFNEIFKEFLGRDHIDLRENSNERVIDFLKKHKKIVAKVTDSLMGNGIEAFVTSEIEDFNLFIESRKKSKQYLLESYFEQHPLMKSLHPSSVNTVRVITFFDGETVHIMETVLKIGNNGSHLDNFGAGGMYTVLSDEGTVIYPAFDKHANAYSVHPLSGAQLIGFQIPLFDKIVETLDRAARVVPEIQYVGWDVAIGEEEPALIEGNFNTGVFQMKPSLTGSKIGLLPKYKSIIKF